MGIYARITGEDARTINTDANIIVNARTGRGIYTFAGISIANINMLGGSITANVSDASGIWVEAQRMDGIQLFLGKIADINIAGNIEVNGAGGYSRSDSQSARARCQRTSIHTTSVSMHVLSKPGLP